MRRSLPQTRKEMEDVKKAHFKLKKHNEGDRNRLKSQAEKAKKEAADFGARVKTLEIEVAALKKKSLTKDEVIKVVEERANVLETECNQKEDLTIEVLKRATEAKEVTKLATERLFLFASILD